MSNIGSIVVYYGLPLLALAITSLAQLFITSNYSKYKQVDSIKGKRGCQVAREILDKHGLRNVKVEQVAGNLTDHYDPSSKVVRLSDDIYQGSSIASVSVAAHECGHAIQDKDGYFFLRFRSALVPFANISSRLGYLAVVIGLLFGYVRLAWFGIALEMVILVFQLITLPVEFDASKRALKFLEKNSLIEKKEQDGSKKMLTAAALTYVASVVSTLLSILRLVLMVSGRDDRR